MSDSDPNPAAGCLVIASANFFGLFPFVAGITCFFAGPRIADSAYQYLLTCCIWMLIASVLLLPLAIFKVSRPFVGGAYVVFSMAAAAFTSVLAITMVAYHWGQGWLLLGLLGPGLTFFALLADLFTGDWGGIGYLVGSFVILIIWRVVGGAWLMTEETKS